MEFFLQYMEGSQLFPLVHDKRLFIYRSSNDFQRWYDHILDHHIWNPGTLICLFIFNVKLCKSASFYCLFLIE